MSQEPKVQQNLDFTVWTHRMRLIEAAQFNHRKKFQASEELIRNVLIYIWERFKAQHHNEKNDKTIKILKATVARQKRIRKSVSAIGNVMRYLKAIGVLEATQTGRANVYRVYWNQLEEVQIQEEVSPFRVSESDTQSVRICESDCQNLTPRLSESDSRNTKGSYIYSSTTPTESPPERKQAAAEVVDSRKREEPRKENREPSEWEEVETELKAAGVQQVQRGVMLAERRKLSPEEVLQAIRTFRANSQLKAGSILYWLRWDAWPDKNVKSAEERERLRKAQQREKSRQRAAELAEQQAARAESELLEQEFGEQLDAMSITEVVELTCGDPFLHKRLKRACASGEDPGKSELYRGVLLEMLADRFDEHSVSLTEEPDQKGDEQCHQ